MADDDLRLLADGSHPRPWEFLGPHPGRTSVGDGVTFRVWAPRARSVAVTGDFCDWSDVALPMTLLSQGGVWECFVPGAVAGQRYRFAVRGSDGRLRHKADPYGQWMDPPPGSASRLVESIHAWSDDEWMANRSEVDPRRSPIRVYEVHLGSWRRGPRGRLLTYGELGPLLAEHCTRLGFTHIELLPIAEHPFTGSWGYQVTGFYAPTARFGTPDELRGMIDLLHRAGIGVFIDWVPAHFASDPYALVRFDGTALFEHDDPSRASHPDWGSLVFNFARPGVRNFLIGNARYWLEEFHVDGLRVDAVASMLYLDFSRRPGEWRPNVLGGNQDLEAIAFLHELNRHIHTTVPGAVTFAEESSSFPGVSRPIEDGGLGFDFKWDLGWMHDTLDYFGRRPDRRWWHRRKLTFRGFYVDGEDWVLPLSHDEVVYGKRPLLLKTPGTELQAFASMRSLLANQIGQPGKKLLFMGSELAPEREWDHDHALPWRDLEADPRRAAMALLVGDLGALYKSSPALWAGDPDASGFAWIDPDGESDMSIVAWLRRGSAEPFGDDLLVIVQNGASTARRYRLGLPSAGPWDEVLNTDAADYGGSNVGNLGRIMAEPMPWGGQPASAVVTVPPLAVLFLRPASD